MMEVDEKGFEVIPILDKNEMSPFVFSHETAVKVLKEAIEEAILELRAIEIEEGRLDT